MAAQGQGLNADFDGMDIDKMNTGNPASFYDWRFLESFID
jgi:hypothetical protein